MRDIERRIDRLEATLGVPGCTCSGPGLEILCGDAPVPSPAPCPVHGERGYVLIVRVAGELQIKASPPIERGPFHTLTPDGRVTVNLPPPARD